MNSNLVYSTEKGRIHKKTDKSDKKDSFHSEKKSNTKNKPVLLKKETKGRKGSVVTLIENLPLTLDHMKDLAKEIKKYCSSGGSIKDGIIEIQGDHRDKIKSLLEEKKFIVKISGG